MELIISIVSLVIAILVLVKFFSMSNDLSYLTKVGKHKMDRDEEIIRLLKKIAGELSDEDKAKLFDSRN